MQIIKKNCLTMFVPKAVFIMEFKFLPLLKLKFTLTQFRGGKNKKTLEI